MRAANEVTVDRLEFKRAVSWTRRGRLGALDKTLLYFEDDGFTVATGAAVTRIKSIGRWSNPIEIHSIMLKKLASKLPREKEITLLYLPGWLMIGAIKITATEVGWHPDD